MTRNHLGLVDVYPVLAGDTQLSMKVFPAVLNVVQEKVLCILTGICHILAQATVSEKQLMKRMRFNKLAASFSCFQHISWPERSNVFARCSTFARSSKRRFLTVRCQSLSRKSAKQCPKKTSTDGLHLVASSNLVHPIAKGT